MGTFFLSKIDSFRVEADMLIQLSCQLNRQFPSENNKSAIRSLKLGKCWLGKLKAVLGSVTPYDVVQDEKQIPKTAEVFCGDLPALKSRLIGVNKQRERIGSLIYRLEEFATYKEISNTLELQDTMKITNFKEKANSHFAEASFFYGFDLSSIRDVAIQADNE